MPKRKPAASPILDATVALAAIERYETGHKAAVQRLERQLQERVRGNAPLTDWFTAQRDARLSVSTLPTSLPRTSASELFPFI